MKTNKYWYFCKECKRLADKDKRDGFAGKYLLQSMLAFKSRKEAIEHLKNFHKLEELQ